MNHTQKREKDGEENARFQLLFVNEKVLELSFIDNLHTLLGKDGVLFVR